MGFFLMFFLYLDTDTTQITNLLVSGYAKCFQRKEENNPCKRGMLEIIQWVVTCWCSFTTNTMGYVAPFI